MLDDKTEEWLKKWREAAKIFAKDVNAKVICPECGIGHLMVKDELVEAQKKLDRYMICDNCGRYNVMTIEIPKDYHRNDSR
jgi:transcription elongation factor Elf1